MDSIRFDIDDICDKSNPLPHMLPSDFEFTSKIRRLGISQSDKLIVYAGAGQMSAAASSRVWWTLKAFGHEHVSILVSIFYRYFEEMN